jgi:hypothetical protein
MLFLMLKKRLRKCYENVSWFVAAESPDKILFRHPNIGDDLYEKVDLVPNIDSNKIRNLTCVKTLNHENNFGFGVYFMYGNEMYVYNSVFFEDELEENLYHINEIGYHSYAEDIHHGEYILKELENEMKELKEFNRNFFAQIPQYRLLLLINN